MATAPVSVVMVGVGGQGILLASEIAAKAAMIAGFDVKTNEVHGMAQRGGSVMGQIRFGREVFSPLVPEGAADVLVALEKIEAIRCAHYLRPGGPAVVADHQIIPVTVSSGQAAYPTDAEDRLRRVCPRLHLIPVAALAKQAGDGRTANVVMMGALSTQLDLPVDAWRQAVEQSVKPKTRELNLKAFDLGRAAARN